MNRGSPPAPGSVKHDDDDDDAQVAAPSFTAPIRPNFTTKKSSLLGKLPRVIPSRIPFLSSAPTPRAQLLQPLDPDQPPLATLVVQIFAAKNLIARDRSGTSDPFVTLRYGSTRITSPTIPKTLNPVWTPSSTEPSSSMDTASPTAIEEDHQAAPGQPVRLQVKIFDSRGLGHERIECVLWDRDRLGKEYLGEVSLSFNDCFGKWLPQNHAGTYSSSGEGTDVPPIGFNDAANMACWYPLKSTRSKLSVTGEILVKVGFAAVDSTAGSKDGTTSKDSSATGILTSEQRQSLVQALTARGVGSSDAMATSAGNVSSPSRLHNTPAHAGQEERILLASPTEGVGTAPIFETGNEHGASAAQAQMSHLVSHADDSSSSGEESNEMASDEDEEDDYGTDVTEGEYDDALAQDSTDVEEEGSDVTDSDSKSDDDDQQQLYTAVEAPAGYTEENTALPSQPPLSTSAQKVASSRQVPQIVATSSSTQQSATEQEIRPVASPVSSAIPPSQRRGLSFPGFMKRNSSRSIATLPGAKGGGSEATTDVESLASGTVTPSGGVSATDTSSRRRFGRKQKQKKDDKDASAIEAALLSSGAIAGAAGGVADSASIEPVIKKDRKAKRAANAAKKGAKSVKRRAAKSRKGGESAGGVDDLDGEGANEGEIGVQRTRRRRKGSDAGAVSGTKRLGRRRTKRDYTYADDRDLLGLVQIEVQGARDLPRWKNAIRVSYDMDPFAVISFGRRVFRTRVIRHSLNPVWDERLFFHVRATEAQWNITFNLFDWDKVSSNDHVGDVTVPLADLIGITIQPNEDGLYPADADGKLVGDEFHPHSLKIAIGGSGGNGKNGNSSSASSSTELEKTAATLQIRAKYTPYTALRQQFWRIYLRQYDIDEQGKLSHLEIFSMLDSLGSTLSKDTISSFFTRHGLTDDQELTYDQVVSCLEQEVMKPKEQRKRVDPNERYNEDDQDTDQERGGDRSDSMPPTPGVDEMTGASLDSTESKEAKEGLTDRSSNMKPINTSQTTARRKTPVRQLSIAMSEDSDVEKVERVVNIKECPLCHKPRMNSKAELDIITHMGICSSTDPRAVNRIVVNEFVTASQAQRKWFTKVISKATKGAYRLGADSANIIVQDRLTGALLEERMATYVRLGMRLAYRGIGPGGGMEGARIRRMLESMSIKQGVKFESPASVREIQPFINFHNLDMSEVLDPVSSFTNFNEFFYRKLKPDARPVAEPNNPNILVSPADCRAMFFPSVNEATRLWIKGREFTVARMLGEKYAESAKSFENASLAIFRLAPQDYHRYHSPVDGVMGPLDPIHGAYFTVNPMAIRSAIDVYGENKRAVASINSPAFGETLHVWVGAMMVGSYVMLQQEGDEVSRGQDLGYFKFGGSTIVSLFNNVEFDSDLVENSSKCIETLVRVGMRIGKKKGTD